jgi:CRP-like cAMP-binding protein
MKTQLKQEYMITVANDGEGKSFGHLALAYDPNYPTKPNTRAATITCIQPCKFAVMGKTDYRTVLDRADQKRSELMMAFLRQIPFMKCLSNRTLKEAQLYMECVRYQVNQPVFYEGMPSNFLMIVKSGNFEITRTFDEDNCYLCGNE